MLAKSVAKIILAGAMTAAAISPTIAKMKEPNACAKPELRCITDCKKDGMCQVYMCMFNKSTALGLPCNEKTGLCWAPHC